MATVLNKHFNSMDYIMDDTQPPKPIFTTDQKDWDVERAKLQIYMT